MAYTRNTNMFFFASSSRKQENLSTISIWNRRNSYTYLFRPMRVRYAPQSSNEIYEFIY